MKEVQRTFIVGGEWIYYKIYAGPKTCEQILSKIIRPVSKKLIEEKLCDKWFFIRYNDPEYHLRVRYHSNKLDAFHSIIKNLHTPLNSFIQNDLVHKIQLDTYNRELERYGSKNIELFEELFFFDSEMVLNYLLHSSEIEKEEDRWVFGAMAVNSILELFGYNFDAKLLLTEELMTSFGKEFNVDKNFKKELKEKYSNNKELLQEYLLHSEEVNNKKKALNILLKDYSKNAKNIVDAITKDSNNTELENQIKSYLHMFLNRLFRSKNRLQEFVLYFMLYRHYLAMKNIQK